ncbi:hypothetical protein TRFO_05514 [Tritrichomonas foetus]|uniref:Uncharacterized protein n=1 Tax=Tritrichomonas foetus TaxID=1144522 RepID=A0A1J4K4N0_9EUKA|nr:hypothetical protein TRFO_05514 [Tritrichomonas foetus]|eukprot:OHT06343.1 hypothetical protein TRFO_05514 [Tritrichomonas foetus]
MRNVNQQSSDSDCSQQESSIPKRHITSNGPEISFEISFQEVIKNNNANVMIPGNIDEYWNSIGCRSSFSNVLSFLTQLTEVELLHIFELDNKEHVFDEEERKIHSDDNDSNSANENNSPHHSVSDLSDFHELVKFFHKILKQDVVVQFLQGNKLCIDRLFEINSSLNESREGKNSNGDQNNDPSQNIEVISNSNDNPFSDNNFASENSSNETANSSENNQKGEDSSSSHQYISAGSFNSEVSNDALPEKTKVLFFSFLEIIKTVMSKIQQLEDRRKILRKFAYFLIPQEILDDFGNHQSIYVITFLPIITGKYYSWLVLLKDKSIILASIDGLEVHYKKKRF